MRIVLLLPTAPFDLPFRLALINSVSGPRRSFRCPKNRCSSLDCYAMPLPFVRPVVPHGNMLSAAIVPNHNIVLLPFETHLEIGIFYVFEKKLQDRLAF